MLFKRFILLPLLLINVIPFVLADLNNLATNKTANLDENMQITAEPLLFDPNLTYRDFSWKLILMHLIIFNIMIVKCKIKVKHGR